MLCFAFHSPVDKRQPISSINNINVDLFKDVYLNYRLPWQQNISFLYMEFWNFIIQFGLRISQDCSQVLSPFAQTAKKTILDDVTEKVNAAGVT